jgi:soluble lytic murein transglycosylase-like protein
VLRQAVVGRWRLPHLASAIALAVFLPGAQAQIYTGITASGSILLTGSPDDVATELLVAAPAWQAVEGSPDNAKLPVGIPAGFAAFIQEASVASRLPPALIHAVIAVESNYNPRAVSLKGAQGLMQLMPATARRFGAFNVLDPRSNILAGSKYLRWLLDTFGQDMELSIAAYNAGEGAVMQAGRKIPRFAETERYVPKVMAIYRKTRPLA